MSSSAARPALHQLQTEKPYLPVLWQKVHGFSSPTLSKRRRRGAPSGSATASAASPSRLHRAAGVASGCRAAAYASHDVADGPARPTAHMVESSRRQHFAQH